MTSCRTGAFFTTPCLKLGEVSLIMMVTDHSLWPITIEARGPDTVAKYWRLRSLPSTETTELRPSFVPRVSSPFETKLKIPVIEGIGCSYFVLASIELCCGPWFLMRSHCLSASVLGLSRVISTTGPQTCFDKAPFSC